MRYKFCKRKLERLVYVLCQKRSRVPGSEEGVIVRHRDYMQFTFRFLFSRLSYIT